MKKIILSMFLLGTLLSANAQVPSYVPSSGLVGWWPFSGNANDQSGNNLNGTVNGSSITTDRYGNINSAYDFNGTSNYIELNPNKALDFTNNYTISCWILIPDYSTPNVQSDLNGFADKARTIISKPINAGWANGWGIKMEPGIDSLLYSFAANMQCCPNINVGSVKKPSLNTWINYTTTYDGATFKLYQNGSLISSKSGIFSNRISNMPVYIGKSFQNVNYNWYEWFKGKIDDIGFWNRALTPSEVKDLYNGCTLAISTEPINQSSNINSQAQFNTLANDTTSSYQWQSNASNMGWSNIPSSSFYSGVATKKLTVNNIKLKNHEQLFRVIATKNTCKDTSVVAMLTVNDTCITSTTDTLYIKVNTSSLSNPIYNTVKVYPNPSSTQVIIDNGNYSTMGSYTAKIVNSIGQQVFQSVINQQQFVIDAKTMGGAGVYTLYITDANNKVVGVKKIVLQ